MFTGLKIKQAVGCVQKLLQYCQFLDKNLVILEEHSKFSWYLKMFIYLFYNFSQNP